MESPTLPQSTSDRYPRVASLLHTIILLAVLGVWAFMAKIFTDHLSAATHPSRVRMYLLTICMEWLVFGLVVAGVRLSGASLLLVLGDHWQSGRQVLRDIGIALGFWMVAAGVLWVIGWLLRIKGPAHNMQLMLPRGGVEVTVWIAMSVTAGICEETIFRGYLQRQFMALTKSAPAGILLSALAFGGAHAYQGFRFVILISVFGAMFGILAYWRGTVRPGMMAHAWQDSLGGVLGNLAKH
ncbi:MAG: CPBP family intramembrane glutamic endopeptidase [Terriglobales bacterium]